MELKQHPLSAAFPAMSAEDFAALVADIKAHGQREPVMLFEGMVLDGWHRYQACSQLGLKVAQFTFPEKDDPVAFVESANLHRRHLTATQRAEAVVAVRAWAPPKRPSATVPAHKGAAAAPLSTNKEMAKAANVSVRTIKDAKAGHKAGLGELMKEGALTAEQAANIARGKPAKKPAEKAPKLAPWDKPAPTPQPELDDAREAVSILAEENDRLNDRLAVEAMDASEEEKLKAAALIAELRADLKTANAELRAVRATRDSYMRENGELKKSISSLQRKLKKLEDHAAA